MISVPYQSSGQQLGETRSAMGRQLMKDLEKCINDHSDRQGKYYVLIHAKPYDIAPGVIKIKIVPMNMKPPMMLSCMLFGVDNDTGVLTLEWALPGSWPTWSVGGTNEPVPEVLGSLKELGKTCNLDKVILY